MKQSTRELLSDLIGHFKAVKKINSNPMLSLAFDNDKADEIIERIETALETES